MRKIGSDRFLQRRGSRLLRQRRQRPVAFRVALVALALLVSFHFIRLHDYYRDELVAKFSPTLFPYISAHELTQQESRRLMVGGDGGDSLLTRAESTARANIRQHRSEWKRFGKGCEGDVFTYGGTAVVKLYNEEKTPFRNCVPGHHPAGTEKWPTEIPATLLLGKLYSEQGTSHPTDEGIDGGRRDFVPVMDYFLVPGSTPARRKGQWHFVTPFIGSGNLYKLAKRIRASPEKHTARTLDNLYRPSFNRLLAALERMHSEYGLCHDDVKPDNIFISESSSPSSTQEETNKESPLNGTTTNWLLADLGNVRHVDHPYHASYLWHPHNAQHRDCRANDALRLARSYVAFLRGAVADVAAFDAAFFAGSEPWSRLYWRAAREDLEGTSSTTSTTTTKLPPTQAPARGRRRAGRGGSPHVPLSAESLRRASKMVENPANYPYYSTRFRRNPRGVWNPFTRMALGYDGTLARGVAEELDMRLGDKWARFWALTWIRGVPSGSCSS